MSAIVRIKKQKGFSVVSNSAINDPALSWEAAGLLAYLLTKPDDWTVRNTQLYSFREAGGHKVNRMLAELKANGYLRRYRFQDEGGKFTWVSEIYEDPSENPEVTTIGRLSHDGLSEKTIGRLSIDGSPIDGSSIDGGSPHIVKTDLQKTDLQKTDLLSYRAKPVKNQLPIEYQGIINR